MSKRVQTVYRLELACVNLRRRRLLCFALASGTTKRFSESETDQKQSSGLILLEITCV